MKLPEGTLSVHGKDVVIAYDDFADARRAFAILEEAFAPTREQVTEALAIADRYLDGAKRCAKGEFYRNGVPISLVIQQHQELRDEIAALSPSPTGGETGAVAVKPLEWEEREEKRLGEATERFWRAQTTFDWGYRVKAVRGGYSYGEVSVYPTADEAKTAAQADYERRVLSAITHPAHLMGEVEAGWLKYWTHGHDIIEKCLAKAAEAKTEDAPIPFVGEEAQIWHQAQADAYRHALEMMGIPSSSGPAIRALLTKLQEGGL